MPEPADPLDVVLAWHEAVNAGDAVAAGRLVTEDVEVPGPRGAAFGRDALRDWLARVGMTLVPRRAFARGREVVVTADTSPPSGDDAPATVATAFLVVDGGIARIARHPDAPAALADAGLNADDAVDLPG